MDEETKSLMNSSEEIKDTVYTFYCNLYKKEEEDISLQSEFLDKLDISLSHLTKDDLDKPLDEDELFNALKDMNDNKSPGTSGLTKEWYLYFWPNIKTPYIDCVREIENKKELTEMQKRGAIKISYKKGERIKIKTTDPSLY